MKNNKYIKIIIGAVLLLTITQLSGNFENTKLEINQIPRDFAYDGCSMIPDMDLLDCCTIHDRGYYFGGSWQERIEIEA